MERFVPERVFVQRGLEESQAARRAFDAAPGAPVETFDDLTGLPGRMEEVPAAEAKRRLVVARRRGGFVKSFPSGRGISSPGWQYFIPAIGCPADCRYCFLQWYHPAGAPVVFAEREAMLAEIAETARRLGGGYFYGGELCDNLMLEEFCEVVSELARLFETLPEATLELRTKSDRVAPLLEAQLPANVVVSWTFSPAGIVERFEPGTATLEGRMEAARRLQRAGVRVGLRLDPLLLVEGWERMYAGLVEQLARRLDAQMVESVHLGCFRFSPELKSAARRRFGAAAPFDAEFVRCRDGKYRYPRPLRLRAYRHLAALFREWDAGMDVRLCMETPRVERDLGEILSGAGG